MRRHSGRLIVRGTGCVLFCFMICALAFLNRTLFLNPMKRFLHQEISFKTMKAEVREDYTTSEQLRGKDELITLNGGYARLCGRTRYNGIQLMLNGMVTVAGAEMKDMHDFANNVISISEALSQKGIEFLYILAPYKVPTMEQGIPTGAPEDALNQIGDEVVGLLREAGVNCLDLRETISSTMTQVNANFYRTDHHWNVDGSFQGYQEIMKELNGIDPRITAQYTDKALWQRYEKRNWWLGSGGRRVGPWFAGLESLTYRLPLFKTNMVRVSPGFGFEHGSFETVNIRQYAIDHHDYFNMDNYSVYIGADYPLTLHRNADATNALKMIAIKDSFMLPVEAFLSTEFMEIDAIDPRYYGNATIMEYIALNSPDLVIMMNTASTCVDSRYADLGDVYGSMEQGEELFFAEKIEIERIDDQEPFYQIPVTLEAGHYYELNIDTIDQQGEDTMYGVNIALYHPATGERAFNTTFDIEYGNQHQYRWAFKTPEEGEFCLLLYNGMDRHSTDEITYHRVSLRTLNYVSTADGI